MDPNEVLLSIGKPEDISENTQMVMWTYASGKIVVFEDGKLTGIVNNTFYFRIKDYYAKRFFITSIDFSLSTSRI